ncbi:MAG: M24 family metallopeptidase [Phycisphaerales bacterium JB052]
MSSTHATVMAGIPQTNLALYHKIRFSVGDPCAYIETDDGVRLLILRDIEMERAKQHARADKVYCPADFAPEEGLDGDRETATAQALAECLLRGGIESVTADRSLPLIYAFMMQGAGIELECDIDLGVAERRSKDAEELGHLRSAQAITESVMREICEMIFASTADASGTLMHNGEALTSERVISMIDIAFLKHGATTPHGSIVACGPVGSDCHHRGEGELKTGQPIIIDIFPHIRSTGYNGDCTRTIVHGEIPVEVAKMHAAVLEAKQAAESVCRAGATGEEVHLAAIGVIQAHGYSAGLPADDAPDSFCSMVHGTGHGIGLEVHEPPLLDMKGPELVVGDVLTIEPGLYCKAIGGLRIEDMVAVTADGCENYNSLPMGLQW